jgi:hypothetical protein
MKDFIQKTVKSDYLAATCQDPKTSGLTQIYRISRKLSRRRIEIRGQGLEISFYQEAEGKTG